MVLHYMQYTVIVCYTTAAHGYMGIQAELRSGEAGIYIVNKLPPFKHFPSISLCLSNDTGTPFPQFYTNSVALWCLPGKDRVIEFG